MSGSAIEEPLIGRAVIETERKIGDTLSAVPWLLELARRYRDGVQVVGNFHPAVRDLLWAQPLTFDEQLPFVESHQVSIRKAFDHANINKCHISQSHFITSGTHSPDLPIELPLYAAPCRLAIGAVICPFTASDEGHSKLWWPERWVAVIDHLVKHRFIGTVYVIGGDADDFEPYRHPNAVPVRNMPLPRVLDLLRQAPVFASADSGPSHLAHFGGVSRHVLMLPGHVAAEVNQNPRGRIIHARASNVTAERMIGEIDRVLAR